MPARATAAYPTTRVVAGRPTFQRLRRWPGKNKVKVKIKAKTVGEHTPSWLLPLGCA
jgi:hypothetical protein